MKHLLTILAVAVSAVVMQFAAGAAFGETLDTLVLNGTTYTAMENSTIGVLTVTDGTTGNVITVPSGMTVTVNVYEGAGKFRKSGAGDLIIKDVCPTADLTVGAGKIFFARSAGVEAFASSAALHLLWEQKSIANRVRLPLSLVASVHRCLSADVARFQIKPVMSHSYSQSAAFAALACYSPSSGVQSK